MSSEERAAKLASVPPHLRVSLWLYPIETSPRSTSILPGYMCPCFAVKDPFKNRTAKAPASDGAPILLDGPMELGETREVDFIFPFSGKSAVPLVEKVTKFYLWESGYLGEAKILKVYD